MLKPTELYFEKKPPFSNFTYLKLKFVDFLKSLICSKGADLPSSGSLCFPISLICILISKNYIITIEWEN